MKSSCALDDKNNIVQLVGYRVRTRGDIGLNPMSCSKMFCCENSKLGESLLLLEKPGLEPFFLVQHKNKTFKILSAQKINETVNFI